MGKIAKAEWKRGEHNNKQTRKKDVDMIHET